KSYRSEPPPSSPSPRFANQNRSQAKPRGPFFHSHRVILRHPHRQVRKTEPRIPGKANLVPDFPQTPEDGANFFRIVRTGSHRHQSLELDIRKLRHLPRKFGHFIRRQAKLGLLSGYVDLNETTHFPVDPAGPPVDFLSQGKAVKGVNICKSSDHVLHLVPLQMADEMPCAAAVKGFPLRNGFLHAAFADV